MKIGIIREGKIPTDKRVALSPAACREAVEKFPGLQIFVQSSHIRCYKDEEYRKAGFEVKEDVSDCDVLLGIKEVPIPDLVPQKTYFFFSHTIKKQAHNQDLMVALLRKHIEMVDYETLTDNEGKRVIAFGRFAGLVGAYNGFIAYGRRFRLFDLKPAYQCFDLAEVWQECKRIASLLPPIKIVMTGSGRVAQGAIEVLEQLGIPRVSPQALLSESFPHPVYAQLRSQDYHHHKEGRPFESAHFFKHPEEYDSSFEAFTKVSDMLLATAYWHPKAPVLFTREQMRCEDFKIKVIADVTCDIDGSIPSTRRPSTIEDPLYDYNPFTERIEPALADTRNITVMAIDNLPNELPRDASDSFGKQLINQVLPNLLRGDGEGMIERATITKAGKLMPRYGYLQDYAEGKVLV